MQETRLPFWTLNFLEEKREADLRPEKALTVTLSEDATDEEAAAKAAGATTVEAATTDAMAEVGAEIWRRGGRMEGGDRRCEGGGVILRRRRGFVDQQGMERRPS
jgi:hypothetical protein